MAPASLASRTSRDSRSASFVISSGDRALPSRTPPLITRRGFALAKSRRPLAASTGSPSTKAMADGPTSWPSKAVTPASLAASSVSVFFTTAKVAFPRSELRSVVICFTESPRYSVSTAAPELRNFSDSSAMAAALSALAMGPPFRGVRPPGGVLPHEEGPGTGHGAHGTPTASELVFLGLRWRPPQVGPSVTDPRDAGAGQPSGLWSGTSVRAPGPTTKSLRQGDRPQGLVPHTTGRARGIHGKSPPPRGATGSVRAEGTQAVASSSTSRL